MSNLLALDVAILPPPGVSDRARQLNTGLPAASSQGLVLDETHLPHITLTQQFVRSEDIDAVLGTVAETVRGVRPFNVSVTGVARRSSVSLVVARTPELMSLHERLMRALGPFERTGGSAGAFADGDARPEDVDWVSGYRERSSFGAFWPHITLGHAEHPPDVEPFEFTAATVATCHLGRFCSCMRVLGEWRLS